ncbi:hypothetical protein B0H34DRAFT_649099 [Crassisporium funariophilum]|nr:hypothetical protein B0H34DRAFT_649099 [Crassisporium funariophilum]
MPASLDPVDPSLHGVLKCKQAGCETQWYHLQCVSLEQIPRNWVCEAYGQESACGSDIILPYIEVCLITLVGWFTKNP